MTTTHTDRSYERELTELRDRLLEMGGLVEAAIARFAETGIGDVKMLAGEERQLRLRAGDWRIRFLFEKPAIIRVLHIRIAARHTAISAIAPISISPTFSSTPSAACTSPISAAHGRR